MPVAGTLEIADLVVFVVLIFIVGSLWILLQARAPIGATPLIGGPGVNLIDGMRKTLVDWANSIEQFLSWQQSQITQLWAAFVSGVMTPALNAIDTALVHEIKLARDLAEQENGLLKLAQAQLAALLTGTIYPAVTALQRAVVADEVYAKTVLAATITATGAELRTAEQELENVRGRLASAEQQLAQTMAALAVLVTYLPLIQGLAGFEAQAAGGVTTLERQIGLSQQQLRDLQEQLAKLLTLGGIAALGAVAIANIIRVAKDPCSACQGTNLLDMELRLELVEAFGET